MSFQHWSNLTYGIEQGECILFLGPDLPLVAPGYEPRLPVEMLRMSLVERMEASGASSADIVNGSIARVAQRFIDQESELDLEVELRDWHEALSAEASVLHDALASVPFRLIVTSSFDPLMEQALRRAGKEPQVHRYHYRGQNVELLPEATVHAPVLFYLHGAVSDPSSVVVTELQLLDFLAAVIGKDPPLPNDLNAALTSSRLFLFLGFGLQQWYLRILLHVLKVLRRGSRGFAIEIGEKHPHPAVADAILFYQQNFKLEVHEDELLAFATELQSRCGSIVPGTTVADAHAVARPPPRGPRIFICHASEDAAHAQAVFDVLVGAKFDPWLDKESLRGGDRWDALIDETIVGVDYFVVLNSRHLAEKARGASYVVKEIKTALRADDMRFDNFIIPLLIDDAPLLGPLSAFHAVDYRGQDGPRTLVRAIKRQSQAA